MTEPDPLPDAARTADTSVPDDPQMPGSGTVDQRDVRRASGVVFLVFALAGIGFTAWTSRLPGLASSLEITTPQVGGLLLCVAIGSLTSLGLSGKILEKVGTRAGMRTGQVLQGIGFLMVAWALHAHAVPLAAAGMVLAGIGAGLWDVAMNVEAAHVEQLLGYTIMPRYHAAFSLGTVAGALVGAGTAALGIELPWVIAAVVVICAIGVQGSVRFALNAGQASAPERKAERAQAAEAALAEGSHAGSEPSLTGAQASSAVRHRSVWLEPRTLLLGLVVLGCSLTEGSAMDWVAKGAVDGLGVSEAVGALVFGLFVTAMTAGRWFGGSAVDRHGRVLVLRLCLGASIIGLGMFVFAPNVWVMGAGVVLWGLGASLGFPVGISAASDDPARAAARVSVVSFISYGAFFMGPPILGFLGGAWGIQHALGVILVPAALSLLLAPITRKR